MTQHTSYDPDAAEITVREDGRDIPTRDGFMTVTLPISSDRRARDGEAFSADRLRGFRQQIDGERMVPVFLQHGRSELSEDRYGALGKIGRVANADLETRDGTTRLVADLQIADPDDLAEDGDTGDVEAALRWVKRQAELGLITASVGWSEETAGRDVPGDAELLEVSLVGIESDPAAQQASAEPSAAATRGFSQIQQTTTTRAENRGLRGLDPHEADHSPAARVREALEALATVREFHRDESRDETPAPLEAIDQLQARLGTDEDAVGERLVELTESTRGRRDPSRHVREHLETVADAAGRLAGPDAVKGRGMVAVYHPIGHSRADSRDEITEAVATIRAALDEDLRSDGFGLAALAGGEHR